MPTDKIQNDFLVFCSDLFIVILSSSRIMMMVAIIKVNFRIWTKSQIRLGCRTVGTKYHENWDDKIPNDNKKVRTKSFCVLFVGIFGPHTKSSSGRHAVRKKMGLCGKISQVADPLPLPPVWEFSHFFTFVYCHFISPWIGKNREKYGVGLSQTPPSLGIFPT